MVQGCGSPPPIIPTSPAPSPSPPSHANLPSAAPPRSHPHTPSSPTAYPRPSRAPAPSADPSLKSSHPPPNLHPYPPPHSPDPPPPAMLRSPLRLLQIIDQKIHDAKLPSLRTQWSKAAARRPPSFQHRQLPLHLLLRMPIYLPPRRRDPIPIRLRRRQHIPGRLVHLRHLLIRLSNHPTPPQISTHTPHHTLPIPRRQRCCDPHCGFFR